MSCNFPWDGAGDTCLLPLEQQKGRGMGGTDGDLQLKSSTPIALVPAELDGPRLSGCA